MIAKAVWNRIDNLYCLLRYDREIEAEFGD
jgi:hypothetical protein